jgi:hypothetical protein
MLTLAFDFSLRSPGVCVCESTSSEEDRTYHLYGFYNNTPDHVMVKNGFEITLLKIDNLENEQQGCTNTSKSAKIQKKDTAVEDLARYKYLIATLFKHCVQPYLSKYCLTDVHVVIESYAFITNRSGSNYKLHEVTGILKYLLYDLGIRHFSTLSSGHWRSLIFGTSKVEKKHALSYFNTHPSVVGGPKDFDLMAFCKRKLGKNSSVPTPVQDICEALCICDAYLMQVLGIQHIQCAGSSFDQTVGKSGKRKRVVVGSPSDL